MHCFKVVFRVTQVSVSITCAAIVEITWKLTDIVSNSDGKASFSMVMKWCFGGFEKILRSVVGCGIMSQECVVFIYSIQMCLETYKFFVCFWSLDFWLTWRIAFVVSVRRRHAHNWGIVWFRFSQKPMEGSSRGLFRKEKSWAFWTLSWRVVDFGHNICSERFRESHCSYTEEKDWRVMNLYSREDGIFRHARYWCVL